MNDYWMAEQNNLEGPEFETAIKEAEALKEQIDKEGGNLEPAYKAIEKGIDKFEKNYDIEMLLPPTQKEPGLAFSLFKEKKDGKGFFQTYTNSIRDSICNTNGKLNELFKSGLSDSVREVIKAIMTTLLIPLLAISVIAPIAVVLIKLGLDAYCKWASNRK